MLQKEILLSEEASDDNMAVCMERLLRKGQYGRSDSRKTSIAFQNAVYIAGSASVVGPKEAAGPLGEWFDVKDGDPLFGKETWEQAESEMQSIALQKAAEKAKLELSEVRFLFGGDLLAQLTATSFGNVEAKLPLFGLYGACSTCAESLTLAAMSVAGGFAEHAAAVTSSHFASAEKEFRFPLGYGSQRAARSNVDRDRERCVYPWHKEWLRTDQRCYTREDC